MLLGIVLPTYNRKDLLKNTISQLKEQSLNLEDSIRTEIIVVIDGSTDGFRRNGARIFPASSYC